jgi:hypothetical protein
VFFKGQNSATDFIGCDYFLKTNIVLGTVALLNILVAAHIATHH